MTGDPPLRVLVSGGHGRLGRRVVPWLRSQGVEVHAPTRADLDWTDPGAVHRAALGADRILAMASWTDVRGAQRDPDGCVRDTVLTTQATLRAARHTTARVRWVGTDYSLALDRGGTGVGWYAAAKGVAERLVLLQGGSVARVSFITPEQVQEWSWVDGVSLSSRCWVDELVPQLGRWVQEGIVPPVVQLGGDRPTTLADLLRSRMPDHRALQEVVTDQETLLERGGGTRPPDTSWGEGPLKC